MAYQQQYNARDQPRQQQYHNQAPMPQGRAPAGYNEQYNDQYHDQYHDQYDYGYDQGQNEQRDNGYYDQQQGGSWGNAPAQYQQQGGYGNANANAHAQGRPAPPQGRQPPGEYYEQEQHDDQMYQQPRGRDPRDWPMGRGGAMQGGMQRAGPGRGDARPPNPPQGQGMPRPSQKSRGITAPSLGMSLSQDNPFPTFPTQKNKTRPKNGSIDETMARMSIGDKDAPQARPQGSPQRPPQGRGRGAPGPAPAQGWGPRHGRGGFSNPDMNRHDSGHSDSNGYGQQYPSPRGPLQQRLPQMNLQDARGPPQKRFDPASPTQHRFGPNIQRSVTMPQNMGSVANAPGYEDQQQWNEPGPVAGYHASTTPNYVPARPSTASGVKGDVRQQQFEQRPPMPPVPYSQQQQVHQPTQPQDSRRGSLDNVYDDYYGDSTATNRHSRVSSIDMPDFDAIPDPGPKHRRGYSIEDHILGISKPPPTQMVAAVTVGPIDSAQAQRERFYQQSARTRSQPDLHGQYGQSNAVYEMAGDAPSVPPLPAAGIEGFSSNGLPNGPRGGAPLPRSMTMGNGPARASPSQGYRPGPGPQQNFDPRYAQQQPPVRRGYSDESAFSEPGFNTMRNGSPMVPGNMLPRPGTAAPAPGRVPNDPVQRSATTRPVNPDALPAHPAPVRAGLIQQNQNQSQPLQATRPPPVRHYNTDPTPAPNVVPQQPGLPPQRRDSAVHPVTHDELNRLRNAFKAKSSDSAVGLQLSKKLVEAASVLADENGTASAKAKNKNREKYILEAHKIVKKLVANGSAEAMFYLADCYGQGRLGLQVDTKEAFVLYQSAAKAGHPGGAYRTAVCCEMGHEEGGGTKKDPLKAVQWYRRAAALGDTPAMYKMGMILLKGLLGQQKNLGEAINMLKRAADNADVDNPHALHELALLYESQTGNERIIRDEAYSLSLFQQAADLGYKFSQFRLGQAYEYGMLGCPIDARTSIAWYTRAAAKEEHQSELALSGWYLTGSQGILEQSDTEAYLWARKAACAEPPLAKALFAMGYFTEVGIGCPRSLEEAKRWYGRAASYKFPKAQERLEELKRGGAKVQRGRERLSRTDRGQQDENCVVM